MSEEKRTPEQQWARAQEGLELHGMTDERWAAYLRYLEDEDRDKLAEVFKRLVDERSNLRDALQDDKQARPENQEQRIRLNRSLRELRARRLDDIRSRVSVDEGYEEEKAFKDIVDDPKQQPIESYEDEDANLGPAVGEGGTLEEAREEWKRNREERDQS
jgi:methylphosphotriester-DNA--protein-cysteine methyltransferase